MLNNRHRTRFNTAADDVVILDDLCKVYGSRCQPSRGFFAEQSLAVGIPRGECFGLVGVNGSGKTTTFKMLTGDVTVTSGTSYVMGHSVTNDIYKVRESRVLSKYIVS